MNESFVIDHDYSELLDGISEKLADVYTILEDTQHPLLETPFEDYSVTEGLLLILVLVVLFVAVIRFLGRCFGWLR